MKILLITVRSDFGGGPRHVDQIINSLPEDFELYLACPKEGDPYSPIWNNNNRIKKIVFIPYRKFSIHSLLDLKIFVKKNNIQIIHSHGNGAGIYSRLLKLCGSKVKVVHTFHGISYVYSSKLKLLANTIVGRALKGFADKYIAVSEGEKSLGIERGFCSNLNCDVIYNGIKGVNICKEPHKSGPIVTLSRYDYQKNMNLCLDIVRILKDDGIRFVWVGDGEDFSSLKKLVETENLPVEMVGFQKDPMKFLQNSCVYLSTSRFEGLPYALVEAASVGLPLVATDVVGNNEVAINNENGFTFKSAEEGATALKRILNDDVLFKKMSKRSRELFEEKFSIEVMIHKLLIVYLNLDN